MTEINAELLAALKAVTSQVLDYERVNNLSPSPGRKSCWDSIEHALATIAKAEGKPPEPEKHGRDDPRWGTNLG